MQNKNLFRPAGEYGGYNCDLNIKQDSSGSLAVTLGGRRAPVDDGILSIDKLNIYWGLGHLMKLQVSRCSYKYCSLHLRACSGHQGNTEESHHCGESEGKEPKSPRLLLSGIQRVGAGREKTEEPWRHSGGGQEDGARQGSSLGRKAEEGQMTA